MRKTHPGYYRPTKAEFEALWKNCTFAFDANVLLNLYRYSADTRDRFLGVLDKLTERIWLPHQAALEYQENRLVVISQEAAAYDQYVDILQKIPGRLDTDLRGKASRHSRIDTDKVIEGIRLAVDGAVRELRESRARHPVYGFAEDSIRDRLTLLFEDDRVGKRDAPADALKKAEARFKANMPPGTKDKSKGGQEQYGDAIIWLQLLEFAPKSVSKSLVFVTDDRKTDWWWEERGETLGPLPELIQEMSDAGATYYQYKPASFLEQAAAFLHDEPVAAAAVEVRDVAQAARDAEADAAAAVLDEAASAAARSASHLETAYKVGLVDALRAYGLSEQGSFATSSLAELAREARSSGSLASLVRPGATTPLSDLMRGTAPGSLAGVIPSGSLSELLRESRSGSLLDALLESRSGTLSDLLERSRASSPSELLRSRRSLLTTLNETDRIRATRAQSAELQENASGSAAGEHAADERRSLDENPGDNEGGSSPGD
jgi:hypothetical protein